ncbi:MAG: glycosyltransferase family 2 protein [Odoribacteraceae bacterium]|jgi:GT2 family glycosyltransferase|nr:glycosyltransferase family 2 protein [Odoribacteraceae bacterium]
MAICAVIVLNWNGEKLLREFLPSVVRHTDPELGRVIVADNHSTDASMEYVEREFPGVERLLLDQNYGFAGGYNRAIRQIDTKYVLLLNSDVEVTEGWLQPLVALLEREDRVAAVQPKIRAYRERDKFEYAGACGGFIDCLGFPFCRGRILNTVERDTGQYDVGMEIFWATGAACCIRREAYLNAGGLDEDFFAHMEEIDLCWRLRNRGYSIKVEPASTVFHLGGGTLPMEHPRKLFLNYRNNLLMLYKNAGRAGRRRLFLSRFALDGMAASLFLVKGEWGNARSILQAYSAYRSARSRYQPEESNRNLTGIYRRSIIWDYFVRHKRIFSKLKRFK